MNPDYFGDSYDIVKRFFCRELESLGYFVTIDPMLTGNWRGTENEFYRLVCANTELGKPAGSAPTALFLDPDTGVNERGGPKHVSFDHLAQEALKYDLVFSFDQSFSRQSKPKDAMQEKLHAMQTRDCQAMYYDSHARFFFVTREKQPLRGLRAHLESLGLPAWRLLERD